MNKRHGYFGTRLYKIWDGMHQRCYNPNCAAYYRYGGIGIVMCEDWKNPKAFIEWAIANGYSKDLSIDRIDNDKGYSPDNCRWATVLEQSRNKKTNRLVEINGKTKTLKEWAGHIGIHHKTLSTRIENGWSEDELLLPPDKLRRKTNKYITINGLTKTLTEWSKASGIGCKTLSHRIQHNWPEDKILSPVNEKYSRAKMRRS